uniref:Uncharacterized protein n=1 Tax=Candidatus Nitrotoga fabula TaxID=2182327 RepID=A0A2X0QTL7_9PROT|nr:protein of unknown function [Candidatus Nitrotoga fabula]
MTVLLDQVRAATHKMFGVITQELHKTRKRKSLAVMQGFLLSGSPTWTRTRDLRINSPSLYRLSYQGIDETDIVMAVGFSVNSEMLQCHGCC